MRFSLLVPTSFLFMWLYCCSTDKGTIQVMEAFEEEEKIEMMLLEGEASVTKVEISGEENAYTFNVTLASPDTGCDQYADWWEVIDLDGNLLYRRILTHSHVDEQPFTRSGGAVEISETTEVYVRAHMNNSDYGSNVQKGSVAKGFAASTLDVEFAQGLAETAPLPNGCAF